MDRSPTGCGTTLAYVAAWLVSSALLVVDVLLIRGALLRILTWISTRGGEMPSAYSSFGWTLDFVDRALMLILACVGVGLSVASQYYYRPGAGKGMLIKRVIRGLGVLLAVGLGAGVLQVVF
jgi:hypothetical protein